MQRKTFITGAGAAALSLAIRSGADADSAIAALERSSGGRLGVFARQRDRMLVAYRADERFLTCSTFKAPLAASILARVDKKQESLDRRIAYDAANIFAYAPIAEKNLARGYMTIRELCAAAVEYSDNTAADLLERQIGGPAALTRYARSIGDTVTTMRRWEPLLNVPARDGISDTTSPRASALGLETLLLGSALSRSSRLLLKHWMERTPITATLLRAGIPRDWHIADKSGTGGGTNVHHDTDTRNDIAVLWPPSAPPIVATVYLTRCKLPAAKRDAILAGAGRIIANAASHTSP